MTSSVNDQFPRGLLRSELFLGVVSAVAASQARLNLSVAEKPSGSHFESSRYGRGEVGELVLVEGQVDLVLARLVDVRVGDGERWDIGKVSSGPNEVSGFVQFLGTVRPDDLRVSAGVANYPRLGDRVYAAPHAFVGRIPHLMEKDSTATASVELNLGNVAGRRGAEVVVRPEKLFGRHCAILGATGGGKSWTVARLVEECISYKGAKLVLLDATGEYRGIAGSETRHVHLGQPINLAKGSHAQALPPTSFLESDFLALFEPAGKVQGPKLRAAIRSLRLASLCPEVATSGIVKKIDQPKGPVQQAEANPQVSCRLDDPRQAFDVRRLVAQIEEECVYPDAYGSVRGSKDHTKWGGESGEFSYCLSLVSRINAVLVSKAFECVFGSTASPVTQAIHEFRSSSDRLLRICLSGVPYEFGAREIIVNVLGRHLLNSARAGVYLNAPLIVIVDEAHNFLGRSVGSDDAFSRLDAFEVIAREGRKYGLNLCLATQRPRDLTEGVLSQIGTLIVHRLTNERDRDTVERACGEVDRSASAFLSNLRQGEAAIIGVDFPIPLTIQIRKPTTQPMSDGPNYQVAWTTGVDDPVSAAVGTEQPVGVES